MWRLTSTALAVLLLAGCGAQPVHVRTIPPPVTGVRTPTTSTTSTTSTTAPPSTTTSTTQVSRLRSRETAPAMKAASVEPDVEVDGIPRTLRRIGGCESSGDPDGVLIWTAKNPHSTASGAFGDLDGTWQTWAAAYGGDVNASSYSRAMDAPADVQLLVNRRAFDAQGTGPWAASRPCWR